MKLIDGKYIEDNKPEIIQAIRSGKIFIYPTDTIYGLGANAALDSAVQKIREIKQRPDKPFSVIAPDKNWILEHFTIPVNLRSELDKLPGPYTLILKKKNDDAISEGINPGNDTVGIRIPDHWFSEIIEEAGVPFITTSVNRAGDKHMEVLEDISEDILNQIDYVIYEGPKTGSVSTKISLL